MRPLQQGLRKIGLVEEELIEDFQGLVRLPFAEGYPGCGQGRLCLASFLMGLSFATAAYTEEH